MEQQLLDIGLTPFQAKTYLFLLRREKGAKPALLARELGMTRTNCYKVLEQLMELDLVRRSETGKTYTYFAEDPIALTALAGRARAHANDLEKRVTQSVKLLRDKYKTPLAGTGITGENGKTAIIQALHAQNLTAKPIYFIKSASDVSFMGYDTMHSLRKEPMKYGTQRYGITPDTPESPANPEIDKRSNLTRTWLNNHDYKDPVEWSVSGDELMILVYENNGKTIRIKNTAVAESFRNIWHLLDRHIRFAPDYAERPKKARRSL